MCINKKYNHEEMIVKVYRIPRLPIV